MKNIKTIGVMLCIIVSLYLNHEIWKYLGIEFPPEIPVAEQYIATVILLGLVGLGLLGFVLVYIFIRDNIVQRNN